MNGGCTYGACGSDGDEHGRHDFCGLVRGVDKVTRQTMKPWFRRYEWAVYPTGVGRRDRDYEISVGTASSFFFFLKKKNIARYGQFLSVNTTALINH